MSNPTSTQTFPAPPIPWPPEPRTKWEREHRAFLRLLPQLLQSHAGMFVAVHDERMIDSDADELRLIQRVLQTIGNVDFHVGHVSNQLEPTYRSGLARSLP